MARRSNTAEVTEPTTEELENQLSEGEPTTDEAPAEEPTTEAEKPAEVTDEQLNEMLKPFHEAVEQALGEADQSTGTLSEAQIADLNKVYRSLDGQKAKNRARAFVDEQMLKAIDDGELPKARSFVQIKENLSAGSGQAAPKPPADPTKAFVQKVASVQIALNVLMGDVPEGVKEGWDNEVDELVNSSASEVEAYAAYLASDDEDAEEPTVSATVRAAFKVVSGRGGAGGSGRTFTGPRRDTEKHLIEVFEGLEPGTFLTINEIAKAASKEYGSDRPSAGAITQRLFPKGKESYDANGVRAVHPEGKGRGAEKVA